MPIYIRLVDYSSAEEKKLEFRKCLNWNKVNQSEFRKIPGSPIAYWVSRTISSIFSTFPPLSKFAEPRQGFASGNNDLFLRQWFEVDYHKLYIKCNSCEEAERNIYRWFPVTKGGSYRKYYGNNEFIADWQLNGKSMKSYIGSVIRNQSYYFKEGLSWSTISSDNIAFRYTPKGSLFETKGSMLFMKEDFRISQSWLLGLLNSRIPASFLSSLAPTLDYHEGPVGRIPILLKSQHLDSVSDCLSITKSDWDLRETSWDFLRSPFLTEYSNSHNETILDENLTDWNWPSSFKQSEAIDLTKQAKSFTSHWTELFLELHKNEEENNRIFIDLYGLQDELTPGVPYSEITILQEELVESARKEGRIEFDESVLARQFVSYGVGCLVGRYSVEKDGLILADAGATLEDFIAKVPDARFLPDPDGILPLTDEDDFVDDLPTRFKAWLRFISGDCYEDNLRWIEERLGADLRSYFIRDFYKEHLRRYKNRPIYWMVTSPSGTFRALLYLHRYTKDSVGKILNDYLRPYRTKLDQKLRGLQSAIVSPSSSQTEKTDARKRIMQLEKYVRELELWEKECLYPTALARIDLDLDDGVKVNYRKLSAILEPVKQLEQKEEE